MAAKVVKLNDISLNGVFYRLTAPIQSSLSSIYAPKQVIGDVTRDSDPTKSVVAWSDWRGGFGLEVQHGDEGIGRCWWSDANLRAKGHLTLPGLATQTAAATVSAAVGVIGELANEVYATFGTKVHKYNNSTDSWGTAVHTLPAAATDILTIQLGGTTYLVIAHTGGYSYSSDGTSWTDDTTDTLYLASWNDKLWGIDNTGQLWSASTIGTEANDARLRLPDGYVTDLLVYMNTSNNPILYAMTQVGLYAHDLANTKFVQTKFTLPQHADNGKGCVVWRDTLYIPAGKTIYGYRVTGDDAAVGIVWPREGDNPPSNTVGTISQLVNTHAELLALNGSQTFDTIMGWDGKGWQNIYLTGISKPFEGAYAGSAYSLYRLWFGYNQRVYWITLYPVGINPKAVSGFVYRTPAYHYTPHFDTGQSEVDKLALTLKVEVAGASATETVLVQYLLNGGDAVSLGTITSDGVTTYTLGTSGAGLAFRFIRFYLTLARGSTNTTSPDVLSVMLEYRKKLAAKWAHRCELDLSRSYKGKTPQQQRAALVTAAESNTLLEFTFRDDAGGTRNYQVEVREMTGLEFTGHDERGKTVVVVAEP